MPVLNTGLAKTSAGGFTIPYSCRFEDGDSATLSKTFAGAGTLTTWTFSCWVKRGNLGLKTIFGANNNSQIHFNASDKMFMWVSGSSYYIPSMVFRDPSAWYHIVVVWNTTAAEADRIMFYVNGVRLTDFDSGSAPAENATTAINNNVEHNLGDYGSGGEFMDGYLAEVHFIDGTAVAVSEFGEAGDYGEWKAKKVAGLTYGTNGFYLDFSDSAALGDDAEGSNDFTVNNLVASDQMLDTPTNSFATWNPLHSKSNVVFAEGNLSAQIYHTGTAIATSTINPSTGKWYFEVVPVASSGDDQMLVGLSSTINFSLDSYSGSSAGNSWGMYSDTNQNYFEGSTSGNLGDGSGYDVDDIIQVAYDMDAGKMWYGKNNTWLGYGGTGNPATGAYPSRSSLTGSIGPSCSTGSSGHTFILNAGQDSSFAGNKTAQGNQDGNSIGDFYYTPPSGYVALCTANLDTPAVTPSEHFDTILYDDGDGAKTGVGFQPDLVWLKSRGSAIHSRVTDAVRGVTKAIAFSDSAIETTHANGLTAFGADGFTVGTDSEYSDQTGDGMVAWNWLAGNATLGTGDFTQGDNASTCSRNVDAGFSIVSYTGTGSTATVGHGLSVAPEMIIIKGRDTLDNTLVYHNAGGTMDETDGMYFDSTGAKLDSATFFNDTAASNTLFTIESHSTCNTNTDDYIAYCFHSVEGYSKVSKYTGNGDADGTFVYTGFRPAYVMIKRTDDTSHWQIHDTDRDTYNVMGYQLHANANDADASASAYYIDGLSNGFKLRMTHAGQNASGGDYIYLAFAETPFKYSNAR